MLVSHAATLHEPFPFMKVSSIEEIRNYLLFQLEKYYFFFILVFGSDEERSM